MSSQLSSKNPKEGEMIGCFLIFAVDTTMFALATVFAAADVYVMALSSAVYSRGWLVLRPLFMQKTYKI